LTNRAAFVRIEPSNKCNPLFGDYVGIIKEIDECSVTLRKVIAVAISANTIENCSGAMDYVLRWNRHFNKITTDRIVFREIRNAIMCYIQDTREHIKCGYHKPAHNQFNVVRAYPNINDYINPVLEIKGNNLPLSWTREWSKKYCA
jgi:hypothetical protein